MIHQPYVSRFDYLVITEAELRISFLFWFIYKTPQYPQCGGLRTDFSTLSVLRPVIFSYNFVYTQAVAYTTYFDCFELGEPVARPILGRVRLGSIRNKNNWNNASKRLFGSYSHSGIPGFPFRLFCSQEQNSRNIFRNIFLFRNIPNERALSVERKRGIVSMRYHILSSSVIKMRVKMNEDVYIENSYVNL